LKAISHAKTTLSVDIGSPSPYTQQPGLRQHLHRSTYRSNASTMPQKPPGIEGNEIFMFRLNWSVLEKPSNTELLSIDAEDKPQWTLLFSSPIADEAATNPPVSRLEIGIYPLSDWEHWQQADEEPPAYGLIENTDGRPISVKQFMEARSRLCCAAAKISVPVLLYLE
jgi:hypothetical protein